MKYKDIASKREREKAIVYEMISLYCRKNHKTNKKDGLCKDCQAVYNYAVERTNKCPFMESKTFCQNCKVHCYKPEMREKIKVIMRFSGPLMIFYHPALAISHLKESIKEKNALNKK